MPAVKAIVFDVNETLLDLSAMRAPVGKALGGRDDLLPLWFSTLLHHSLVATLTGNYQDFADIGAAALVMLAEREGIELGLDEARAVIAGPITTLPPHPDVRPGLHALSEQGFRIACLTNSSRAGVTAQLENAGIAEFFEQRLSVETVRAFKPAPQAYRYAAETMNVEPAEALMVAAHAWDLMGARAQGLQTAFIRRRGATLYPGATKPDFDVADLADLVTELKNS